MPTADGGPLVAEPAIGDDRYELTRRLSDKILTAFNHAYAIGEVEIAEKLRHVLIENENGNGAAERRGAHDPLGQAERWIDFAEARNHYKSVCEKHPSQPGVGDEALEAMKEAYRRWTDS